MRTRSGVTPRISTYGIAETSRRASNQRLPGLRRGISLRCKPGGVKLSSTSTVSSAGKVGRRLVSPRS